MPDYYRNQPQNFEDPYERGFADKLYEDMSEPQYVVPDEKPPKRKKKRRWLRWIIGIVLATLILVIGATAFLYFYSEQPTEGDNSREMKDDVSAILVAGTDESGLLTDTIMLLCTDRENKRINIMSIPRDTKVNLNYSTPKINLAYHLNGRGEEGMEALMKYVGQCVGFMPNGYVLLDLDCFIELVDLFGGVEFEVPCTMYYEDPAQDLYINLEPGLQKLDGEEVMGVVRFRSGYAMADLQRVNVQRDFIFAAMKQWATVRNVTKLPKALDIMDEYSLTDLSKRNFLWLAWSVLICGTDDIHSVTIPWKLDGGYVEIEADEEYIDMINEYFNPYEEEVELSDLKIAD